MRKSTFTIMFMFIIYSGWCSAGWSPFYEITSNYFQPVGQDDQAIIVTFPSDFHTCGWNSGATVQASNVGSEYFKTISSVILSAIVAKKKISILTSEDPNTYCSGSKARILAIRLE